MNKTKFSAYIDEMNTVFMDYRKTAKGVEATLQEATKAAAAAKNDRSLSAARRQVATETLQEAKQKHKADLEAAQTVARRELIRLRNELIEDTREFLAADPEAVDPSTVTLLQSGILTDNDLLSLAGKFRGNVTMLRLIGQYAEQMQTAESKSLAVKIADFCDEGSRLAAFDRATYCVKKGLAPEYLSSALEELWSKSSFANGKADMASYDNFS